MASPRLPLSRLIRRPRLGQTHQTRQTSTTPPGRPHLEQQQPPQQHDPHALLSKPTWSIRALLPPSTTTTTTPTQPHPPQEPPLTPPQLHHLLNLSALPHPPTPSLTTHMLTTLHAQLHFVRDIQRVPTANIPPLSAIRDETAAGQREAKIGLETAGVAAALRAEEVRGRCRRPRRRRGEQGGDGGGIEGVEDWDVLGGAGERVGRYFVVRSGKGDGVVRGADAEGRAVKGEE
ncbi:hypothetical protein F5144DRAFT_344084 [Chaetomium tenue]|uniref:Uncharacterized protein n=1 Tax=Chaetomium tenue TaxID=1854479 RepID=A0ACB7NX57_9PEZI|nr:hypothetical protein F5144DRAFT_344084 [Chaetomium globosum]